MEKTTLSGPLFDPSEDEWRKSLFSKAGGHYNIYATKSPDAALAMLKHWFPDGECNEMNLVFFSTSGVHGSYTTIGEVAAGLASHPDFDESEDEDWPDDYHGDEVTFLLVQPRIVSMTYGNLRVSPEDVDWLYKLRASSWKAAQSIGAEPTGSPAGGSPGGERCPQYWHMQALRCRLRENHDGRHEFVFKGYENCPLVSALDMPPATPPSPVPAMVCTDWCGSTERPRGENSGSRVWAGTRTGWRWRCDGCRSVSAAPPSAPAPGVPLQCRKVWCGQPCEGEECLSPIHSTQRGVTRHFCSVEHRDAPPAPISAASAPAPSQGACPAFVGADQGFAGACIHCGRPEADHGRTPTATQVSAEPSKSERLERALQDVKERQAARAMAAAEDPPPPGGFPGQWPAPTPESEAPGEMTLAEACQRPFGTVQIQLCAGEPWLPFDPGDSMHPPRALVQAKYRLAPTPAPGPSGVGRVREMAEDAWKNTPLGKLGGTVDDAAALIRRTLRDAIMFLRGVGFHGSASKLQGHFDIAMGDP
jgi:hypothetical protein